MRDGGTDGGENDGNSRIGEPRLEIPVFRNRDIELVVDEDYWMYVVVPGDTYALPQNSPLKFVALLLVTAAVVRQITTSLESAFFWVVSVIDGVFQLVYIGCRATSEFISSKQTTRSVNNIYKILLIVLVLLAILDGLGVIDVTAIQEWFIPI